MKIFTALLALVCTTLIERAHADYSTTIYTPNLTPVNAFVITYELDPTTVERLNIDYTQAYPEATFLGSATRYYNCHAYTFTDLRNINLSAEADYTGNVVPNFWLDGSYNFSVYGIMTDADLYANRFNGEKVYWTFSYHSGRVNSSDGTITSKWGLAPLMRHKLWPGFPYDWFYSSPYTTPVDMLYLH
jgi:hypothetical protein